MFALTPLDEFARPAQVALLLVGMAVLAVKVSIFVYRQMTAERYAEPVHRWTPDPVHVRVLRQPYDWRDET